MNVTHAVAALPPVTSLDDEDGLDGRRQVLCPRCALDDDLVVPREFVVAREGCALAREPIEHPTVATDVCGAPRADTVAAPPKAAQQAIAVPRVGAVAPRGSVLRDATARDAVRGDAVRAVVVLVVVGGSIGAIAAEDACEVWVEHDAARTAVREVRHLRIAAVQARKDEHAGCALCATLLHAPWQAVALCVDARDPWPVGVLELIKLCSNERSI
jgi:hypothetical protein